MKRLQLVPALLVGCVFLLCVGPVHAQRSPRFRPGYQPSRPTLSPWFELYRRDSGPLDTYHEFVRPKIQLRDTLRRHSVGLQRQQAGLQRHEADLQRQGAAVGRMMSVMGQAIRPTGTASRFMNYSHYYSYGSYGRR